MLSDSNTDGSSDCPGNRYLSNHSNSNTDGNSNGKSQFVSNGECPICLQAMVAEPLAAVRCTALRCLGKVLEAVDSLPPSDAKLFNE